MAQPESDWEDIPDSEWDDLQTEDTIVGMRTDPEARRERQRAEAERLMAGFGTAVGTLTGGPATGALARTTGRLLSAVGRSRLGQAGKAALAQTPILGPMGKAAIQAYRDAGKPIPYTPGPPVHPTGGYIRPIPEARGPSAYQGGGLRTTSAPGKPAAQSLPPKPEPPNVVASPEEWARWEQRMELWRQQAKAWGTYHAGPGQGQLPQ